MNRRIRPGLLVLMLAALPSLAQSRPAGAPAKVVSGGDLNDLDYWQVKFDLLMLRYAQEQQQSPGAIDEHLAPAQTKLEKLVKKYPAHIELAAWKRQVDDFRAAQKDAPRGKKLSAECPWDEDNFEQLWVNVHWARELLKDGGWARAGGLMENIRKNLDILTQPGRTSYYPTDLRKWLDGSKLEVQELSDEIRTAQNAQPGTANVALPGDRDVNGQDYWQARFDGMMLEEALKSHQPDAPIHSILVGHMHRLEALARKYPNNLQIAALKTRAEAVDAKLIAAASEGAHFTPGFPWEDREFAQAWVNYHWAKTAMAEQDYVTAVTCLEAVQRGYASLAKSNRQVEFPEVQRQWLDDHKNESEQMLIEARKKVRK